MNIEVKSLPRAQAEVTIELSVEEYQPFLEQAAKQISEHVKIPGFRPGKAGLDIVKAKVGENEIWTEAFEPAVKKTLFTALMEKKLDTVGQPQIDVIKMAPGNPVAYKATVSLFPSVKLAEYQTLSVAKKPIEIKEEKIDFTLKDLQKMRAKEVLVNREVQKGDKVEINFETFMEKVPIENGQHQKYPIIIGDGQFIPGFEDQLISMKKDDEKTFPLKFPENYPQKNLAGKEVDFKVKMLAVYSRELPELNDEFAVSLGQFKTLTEAKEKIKENLVHEAEHEAHHQLEEAIVDVLIEKSDFGDVPDLLINSEAKKMVEELQQNVQMQGLPFEDYLTHLKKTREDLLLEFAPQALKRVKGALVMREVAQAEKIEVNDKEVETEIANMIGYYGNDPEMEKKFKTPAYLDYTKNILASRKTMAKLEELMVKE